MARIKFGMMMTDARGKLGGQVFSRNRAGAYVRTKVTPSNPRSMAQMSSRSILGGLSVMWNSLTLAKVAAWNAATADWQKTDIFGDLKKPTGKNLFVQLNKNLQQSGQAIITDIPAKLEIPIITATGVVIDVSDTSITFTGLASVPAGVKLQISATPVIPNGQNYVTNKLRVIGYLSSGAITGSAVWALYVAKFGALVNTDRVFIELKYIAANGQASVPLKLQAIAQA